MSEAIAKREIDLRGTLLTKRNGWHSLWNDCAAFCRPDKKDNMTAGTMPNNDVRPKVAETSTGINCLATFAGGLKNWMVPGAYTRWWKWDPHPAMKSPAVADWLADCTERAEKPLAASGFYESAHEMFQDLGAFGTGGLLAMPGKDLVMRLESVAPNEFVFQRDWEGNLSRFILTYWKTAEDLVRQFEGKAPQKAQENFRNGKVNELHEIIFSIHRRMPDEVKVSKYPDDPEGMPFAGCWISVEDKSVMLEEGFEEMPAVVPRWQKWSNSNDYGVSPAMMALADLRGLDLIEMIQSVLGELQVSPRVKRLAEETGVVDLSPGGVTTMMSKDGVSEWAPSGNWNVGKDMIERKQLAINELFHVSLFRSLVGINREMTAAEVNAREQQSANLIAPGTSRVGTEGIDPLMRRVFMVLYRKGHFAPAPNEAFYVDGAGQRFLPFPRTTQTNRMSRIQNSAKSVSFSNALARDMAIAQAGRPEVLDLYDMDKIVRDLNRADGIPGDWMLSETDVQNLRAARAKAQQEQAMQQAGLEAMARKPGEVASLMGGAA